MVFLSRVYNLQIHYGAIERVHGHYFVLFNGEISVLTVKLVDGTNDAIVAANVVIENLFIEEGAHYYGPLGKCNPTLYAEFAEFTEIPETVTIENYYGNGSAHRFNLVIGYGTYHGLVTKEFFSCYPLNTKIQDCSIINLHVKYDRAFASQYPKFKNQLIKHFGNQIFYLHIDNNLVYQLMNENLSAFAASIVAGPHSRYCN